MTFGLQSMARYCRSYDIVELILCLAFAVFGARFPYLWQPSDRLGVPYQAVTFSDPPTSATEDEGNANEEGSSAVDTSIQNKSVQFMLDLTFDRTSDGEKVSTAGLAMLGIVLPLVFQCFLFAIASWWKGKVERRRHNAEECETSQHFKESVEDVMDGLKGCENNETILSPEPTISTQSPTKASAVAASEISHESASLTVKKQCDKIIDTNYFIDASLQQKDCVQFIHKTICTYATTMGMSLLFVESTKRYVGYMRPNFYQYCSPSYNDDASALVCNEDESGDYDMERYQSFPSGHASVAYSGMTLLSLFFCRFFGFSSLQKLRQKNDGKYFLMSSNHRRLRRLLCFISVFLCQSLALWIAISRVADQEHHPVDVVGGALFGAGCAYFLDGLWEDG